MGTSLMVPRTTGQQPVDLNALNLNLPAAPVTALNAGREREAQHLRRIRELEEELRVVRRDNEKQVSRDSLSYMSCSDIALERDDHSFSREVGEIERVG